MRIFIYYETTDMPWGGINTFFGSFKDYLNKYKKNDVIVVNDMNDD